MGAGVLYLAACWLAWQRGRRLLAFGCLVVAFFCLISGAALWLRISLVAEMPLLQAALLLGTAVTIGWVLAGLHLLDPVNERRALALERTADAYLLFNSEGCVLDLNPAARRLLGRGREVIGQPAAAALAHWPELLPHLQGEDSLLAEISHGSSPPQNLVLLRTPLRFDQGRSSGTLLVLHPYILPQLSEDQTTPDTAPLDLSRARSMVAAVVRQAPIPMILVTLPDTVIQVVNRPAIELLDLESEQDLVGRLVNEMQPSWQIFDEQGQEPDYQNLPMQQAVYASRQIQAVEYRLVTRLGHERWVQISSAPVIYNGTPIAATVSYADVSARRQAEVAVRSSEERYRLLADNARDVIWTVDLDGNFTYISPSVERLRGFIPAEAVKQTIDEAFEPEGASGIHEWLNSARRVLWQGRRVIGGRFEVQELCKDGTSVATEVNLNPMYNSAGHFSGFVGVSRDISQTKIISADLNRKSSELERLSITDALTGLFNRRHTDEKIAEEFQRCLRYGTPLSLGSFDLDHFKQVNDRFGHACGDEVIRAVANEIRTNIRAVDIASRVGGEEFLILFPNTRINEAFEVMERLRRRLSESIMPCTGEAVTISGGVTAWFPGDTAGEALRRADRLLYQAKDSGRNLIIKDTIIR
jgi:diguanylate cyclase (GGDEF)-like protein/PAS domain S-box-containing protein